ncbi:MAG: cytochrome c [Bacteroidota bacterium]
MKNIILVFLFILLIASCTESNRNESNNVDNGAERPAKNIHDVETQLASGQGEELIKTHCLTCHSLRYIKMQPSFPQKTWEKIVGKMVKNFGAPIPDSTAKEIVDYLVAVKGNKK